MKQVFKSILIAVCFVLAFNFISVNKAEASVTKNKTDIVIIRTQEDNINYISIYSDGVLIVKVSEL